MKPTRSRRSLVNAVSDFRRRSAPAMWTSPVSGRSRPAATCSKVLFPEPDGPITAVNVPGLKAAVTPRRAWMAFWPRP